MKPKLRFKNHNDDWITCTIKDVADVIGGGTPDTSNPQFWNGNINWFTPSEIGKSKYISKSERKITELGVQKSSAKLLPIGTILLSSRATVGEASILEKNQACTNQGFQSLIANEKINNEFLYYLKDKYKKDMLKKAFGSTFLEISKSNIEKIKINIPTIEEQIKVSNFLSLLDRKIELQSKKIEDLKLFKKGLSNDLIDCINEYNEFTLEDIGTTYSGLSGKAKEDFENGNSKFISFISVLKDKIEVDKLPTVKIDSNENQNKVQKNDLFFNTSSETKEEVALCSTINEDIDNLYLNSFCFGYRINNLKLVNNEYLNIMLHCTSYRKLISNLGQGFTRVNISKKELMNLIVKVPSIDVQIKIVDIINKVKNIIDLEVIKLSKLLDFKKGLMQQLFI